MKTFEPGSVVLGATPFLNSIGQHSYARKPKSKKTYPEWNMPRPIRDEPHWMNPKKRVEAEAKGLDRMTAGVGFVIMVPVYRGVSCKVFATLKNQARRKAMNRWSN